MQPVFAPGTAMDPAVQPAFSGTYVSLQDCPTDETRAPECRMHWGPMLIESILYNAFEDAGNLYTGYWYRYETTTGNGGSAISIRPRSGGGITGLMTILCWTIMWPTRSWARSPTASGSRMTQKG